MNALVKKEIRLLLPTWLTGLILAILAWVLANELNADAYIGGFLLIIIPFFLSPAMVVMMALNSFGQEVSAGTFSNLLAQPISRSRIWWTKTLLLGVATATIWSSWWFAFSHNKNFSDASVYLHEAFLATILFPIAAYSGGLWTVLLLRQVAAAFWFTLILPATLAFVAIACAQKYSFVVETSLTVVLSGYSIAGFLFARWLFLRAQDIAWTGGVIALPEWRSAKKIKMDSATRHGLRPLAALFWKEIQLHQSQFVLAGVLALLHLAVILVGKFGGEFAKQPVMEFMVAGFWTLWFVMPMLIGCAAVSEERKLGTLESQLCLPVRPRTQFWIKFWSALLLSVVFGFLIPLLFEGKRILPAIEMKAAGELAKNFPHDAFVQSVSNALLFIGQLLPILIPLGIIVVILTVSFFASTLARNTLQSLAPAVLGIGAAFMVLMGAGDVEKTFHYPLWRGWLIYIIGVPIMALTVFALMEWNFKQVWIGWRVARRNATVFVAALAFVIGSTTAIYHRTWEFLTRLEPPHGMERPASAESTKLQGRGNTFAVLIPDGRIWIGNFSALIPNFGNPLEGRVKISSMMGASCIPGSNWTSLTFGNQEIAIVRDDGSLWAYDLRETQKIIGKSSATTNSQPYPLVRIGEAKDWKKVAGRFALKTNGTLWKLGSRSLNLRPLLPNEKPDLSELVGLRGYEPTQLGSDSDWTELSSTVNPFGLTGIISKKAGQTWSSLRHGLFPESELLRLDEKTVLTRSPLFEASEWRDEVWVGGDKFSFAAGVRKDGTLRIFSNGQLPPGKTSGNLQLTRVDVQIGKRSDWIAMASTGETVVTLSANGSLWKWKFPDDPVRNPNSASMDRLSRHSDWVAIRSEFGGMFSLAADGSLWFWQFDSRFHRWSDAEVPALLAPSRKPQKLANVFDAPSAPQLPSPN